MPQRDGLAPAGYPPRMRWIDRGSGWALASWIAGVTSGAWLVPEVAEACSCAGEANIVVPVDDDEAHPASAGLLFDAFCFGGTFEIFSATIDDVPATLSVEYVGGDGWHLATLDPLPEPGQVVVVSRCGLADGYERCTPETPIEPILQYVAGPDDAVAPAAGGAVTLHHEAGEFEVGCLRYAALRFDLAVSGLDPAAEPDLLYMLELRDAGGRLVQSTAIHAPEPISTLDTSFYLTSEPADAAGHCVSVTAVDLSGNSTLVAELCGSESLDPGGGTGTGDDTGDPPPADSGEGDSDDGSDPPADDTTPNDDGSSTDAPDADGALGDRGCSCRATTPAPSVGWLALLAWVATGRRTRRR